MKVKFKHLFGLSCPSKSVSNTLSNKQFQLVLPWRINRNIGTIDLVASIAQIELTGCWNHRRHLIFLTYKIIFSRL